MRGTLSEKNEHAIGKHRYYELKHFCMQYPSWKEAIEDLNLYAYAIDYTKEHAAPGQGWKPDPTPDIVDRIARYNSKIDEVNDALEELDQSIAKYILEGVTEGRSYEMMNAKDPLPCCRDYYYREYRRFFWELSRIHG